MPKISIIIPVYNVEKYIKQSLDSVVNQTLSDLEIICIDDCSTDNSYEILKEYASKDHRFIILKQEENQGQGAARNKGLDIAKGEYIMFLDPDDWYELNTCELCYNQITKNKNDMVLFGHNRHFEKNGETKDFSKRMLDPYREFTNNSQIFLDNLETNYIISCFTVCHIYKKSLLNDNNIRYPKYKNFEDHLFYEKAILYADNVSVIDKPLYNYRIRSNSSTYTLRNQQNDILAIKELVLKELENKNFSVNKRAAVYAFTIISSLDWYTRYTKMYKFIEKDFYNNIKKVFSLMDKDFIDRVVKRRLSVKIYNQFCHVLKYSYFAYKFNNFISELFSITNDEQYKIIRIFGIKIKKQIDISWFHFGILSFMFSWLLPTKDDRQKFRDLCNEIDERKSILKVQKNYKNILKRIKNKKGKIKVLFLVCENSKWKAQSLYDLMAKSDMFEPVIALSILEGVHIGLDSTRNEIDKNSEFFKSKGMNVVFAYKNKKFVDLKNFNPDIVFYEQPWALPKKHYPSRVGKYALLCYMPYYVNTYGVYNIDYDKPFHKYLFRHYVLNKDWEIEYKKLAKRDNIFGLGHTILDNFYLNKDKKHDKNYVIYAPHFSFPHDLNENEVNYGTFLQNGYKILEYAKAHPELNWVFKPHPTLKHSLLKIGVSKKKVEQYYNDWETIGTGCYDSSYIDLFMDSKALITDCASFLTEYFCTKKPLIHLICDDCKVLPNKLAKKNFNTFYQVHNIDEMYETFDKVLDRNIDDKKEDRLRILEETGLLNNYAAQNILDELKNTLSV